MRRSLAIVLALIIGWSLAACGLLNTDADETKGWSAAKLYAEAKQSLGERDYDQVVSTYQKLEARYPYGRLAQQAQIEIAYAHYKGGVRWLSRPPIASSKCTPITLTSITCIT